MQSSVRNPKTDADPDNRLLGRFSIHRLDAEAIRDATLAVSGRLNPKPFGPPVSVMDDDAGLAVIGKANRDGAGYKLGDESVPAGEESRRSIYVQVRRTKPLAVLDVFDWATVEPNCEARKSSTATPQSLLLMNNEFNVTEATHFADRVKADAGSDVKARIVRGWQLAFGVPPEPAEVDRALAYVAAQTKAFEGLPAVAAAPNAAAPTKVKKGPAEPAAPPPSAADRALAAYCQVLLMSNRFLYVD